jgi:50S ribosomal protein L16 3-hydroxylase
VRLDLGAQLLYDRERFYLNGEVVEAPAHARPALERLADARALGPADLARADAALLALLHDWHGHGYLALARG